MSTAELRSIAITQLYESPNNPRASFDAASLAELAASIRENGVLTPLLVRPNGKPDRFEILAGHRRYRAAKDAGLVAVPALVRELDDRAAAEVMILDNLQREDVHPLDEALGYKRLIAMGPGPCKAQDIAAKIGKSQEYVYARLKLLDLTPEAVASFRDGRYQAGHAILLARLDADEQAEMLRYTGNEAEADAAPVSVRELEDRIRWMRERKKREAERKAERDTRKGEAHENPQPAQPASPRADWERQLALDNLKRQAAAAAWSKTVDAILAKLGSRELPRAAWLILARGAMRDKYMPQILRRRGWKNATVARMAVQNMATSDIPRLLLEAHLADAWDAADKKAYAAAFGVKLVEPEPVKLAEEAPAAKKRATRRGHK